jgi:hypothetical protein
VTEKDLRTPAQRKLDTQLLYALYERRGESARRGTPSGPFLIDVDGRGRVLVDIRAPVTDSLVSRIEKLGGELISTSPPDLALTARIPLDRLEQLAGRPEVRFIQPAPQALTNH